MERMLVFGILFEFAPVAQLDRALRFERSGRRFESVRARHQFLVLPEDKGDDLYRRPARLTRECRSVYRFA